MSDSFTAACVQLNSGPDPADNIATVEAFIREAAGRGASLIMTPETTDLVQPDREKLMATVRPEDSHRGVARFPVLARELSVWLVVGSFLILGDDGQPVNRSFLIGPDGAILARYDKIHMFDVTIPDGQSYRESERFTPGARSCLAALPWGAIGLTICYDMRFPALYRDLAGAGALYLTAPSAFTRFTGEAHWHALLRARAIETGSYVFAPAQCGDHEGGRKTYGHSLMVSPWGEVLADGGEEPGVILAEIDPAAALAARRAIPALTGGRDFSLRTA